MFCQPLESIALSTGAIRESIMHTIKKRFVPQFIHTQDINPFAEMLKSVETFDIKEDSVVKGQVISIGKDVIIVDVGIKNEGRVPIEEFLVGQNNVLPQVGDIVDVYVEKLESRNGRTILSREKAIRQDAWSAIEKMFENKELVEGAMLGRVKGGFTVDIFGVIAFLPGSQLDVRPIKDVSHMIGVKQPFLVLKMDKKLGNIVVSRRAILEESRLEARDAMLSQIREGEVYEGIVKNITDYGAFVDLGNIDGLLHVTDISWSRINHPSEVLSIGQKVSVMVIKFSEDSKRISLGIKQLDDSLWQDIAKEFPVGQVFHGKISNISDYGAFIELKNGVEGLVHSSEISWLRSHQNSKKFLSIGQEVEFKILDIDVKKHRVSLSIKQCQENPLILFASNNPVGSVIKAPIRNVTDFGIFVAIADQFDGMIHESDISYDGNGVELLQFYKKGDDVECKILSIDLERERVSLGIKQLQERAQDDAIELVKGMNVTCIVSEVSEKGLSVTINDGTRGFIKKGDLSSDKSSQRVDRFAFGDKIDAKVIFVDQEAKVVNLSIKAMEIEDRENAIKEYGSTDSGARLGDVLGVALGEDKK